MFCVEVPLSKSGSGQLMSHMKRVFGDRVYKYKKDELESANVSFLLSIANVACLKDLNLGVFARQPIGNGTILGYYEGERVDLTDDQRDTTYLMYLNQNNTLGIDGKRIFNWTRFMNHSDFSFNCHFQQDAKGIYVISVCDILKGDQLLINYGAGYHFKEKMFLHTSHNHQSPEDIVNLRRDSYIYYSYNDFETLLGDKNIFLDDQYDFVRLTTLSELVLRNSSINKSTSKSLVEIPTFFLKETDTGNDVYMQEITPLMLACYKGCLDNVKTLLQIDADPLRSTIKYGRNSFVFTILSKTSLVNKMEILKLLLKKFHLKYQLGVFDDFFIHGKDMKNMSMFEYLLNSNLVSHIIKEETFLQFKEKIVTGNFPNKYSAKVVSQLTLEDVEIHFPAIQFRDDYFHVDPRIIMEDLDFNEIEKKDYLYVKYNIDRKLVGEIKDFLDECDKHLNNEDMSLEMYQQVFTHSAAYIESHIDFNQIRRTDEILSFFENKITWEMKLQIFSYALQNIQFWHGRIFFGKSWNSKAGIEYIERKLFDIEYDLISMK